MIRCSGKDTIHESVSGNLAVDPTACGQGPDGATVEGYVVLVKLAGAETCNCKKTAKKHKDVHIEASTPLSLTSATLSLTDPGRNDQGEALGD